MNWPLFFKCATSIRIFPCAFLPPQFWQQHIKIIWYMSCLSHLKRRLQFTGYFRIRSFYKSSCPAQLEITNAVVLLKSAVPVRLYRHWQKRKNLWSQNFSPIVIFRFCFHNSTNFEIDGGIDVKERRNKVTSANPETG